MRMVLAAGVDEAGRGPLCGPVHAAAVGLDDDRSLVVQSSKVLRAIDDLNRGAIGACHTRSSTIVESIDPNGPLINTAQ